MKKAIARIAKAAAFFALLAAAVAAASGLLMRKESVQKLGPFYERADEIDVLLLGSSHMLAAVYPMELWHDYGITAYNFGNYHNTIPISYWLLQNALDVCTPKLVVIDIDDVGQPFKVGESSADVHTALDGLRPGLTKARAIEDLLRGAPERDDAGNLYADLKWEYYFPLALYHARWQALTREDLSPEGSDQLGAQMIVNVAEPEPYGIVSDASPGEGWGFAYLRRLVTDCEARGIGVLLVNVPYPPADTDIQRDSNAVYNLAQECGVEFVDFVYMDQIVDYATDCADPASHLNPSGARKVTDYLGALMRDVYDVPDRRGEAFAAAWDADYDAYVETKLQQLREQNGLENFLMLLHDGGLSACVGVPRGSALYQSERAMRLLQNVGRRHLFEADTYDSVWADSLLPLTSLEDAAADGEAYLTVIDRGAGRIWEAVGGEEPAVQASFGDVALHLDGDGVALSVAGGEPAGGNGADVQIAVIDERTDRVAMVKSFTLE